ncbi:MAG: GNAT family N-acetyltransferase [Pseudonocardiales bacterium]
MRRGVIRIRQARLDDLDVIAGFASLVPHLPANRRRGRRLAALPDMRERYVAMLIDPRRRVILAVGDADDGPEKVLGMAVLAQDVAGELLDVPVVRMSHLVVDRSQRRRGAGRALMAAAASYAEEAGVDHVTVGLATTDRDSNRFLARLGFAPVAVHRIAPLAALRHLLAVPQSNEVTARRVHRNSPRARRALARSPLEGERDLA